MVFMASMYGQTYRTDEPSIFAVRIDTEESGILLMRVAVIGFDELLKGLFEMIQISLYSGHVS
jgi:hypothetical protein